MAFGDPDMLLSLQDAGIDTGCSPDATPPLDTYGSNLVDFVQEGDGEEGSDHDGDLDAGEEVFIAPPTLLPEGVDSLPQEAEARRKEAEDKLGPLETRLQLSKEGRQALERVSKEMAAEAACAATTFEEASLEGNRARKALAEAQWARTIAETKLKEVAAALDLQKKEAEEKLRRQRRPWTFRRRRRRRSCPPCWPTRGKRRKRDYPPRW